MIQKLKHYFFPILFSATISTAFISALTSKIPLIFLLISILTSSFVFCFLSRYKNNKKNFLTAFFLFTAGTMLIAIFCINTIFGISFERFIMSLTSKTNTLSYLIVISVFYNLIISSFIYYFCDIQYRSTGLFLIIFIPCAILWKNSLTMPLYYLIIISILYICTIICFNSSTRLNTVSIHKKIPFKVFAVFLFFVTVFTIAVPKDLSTPFPILQNILVDNINYNFSKYQDTSSKRGKYRENDNEIIFSYEGSQAVYLKRQAFNIFNNNQWSTGTNSFFLVQSQTDNKNMCYCSLKDFAPILKDACEHDDYFAKKYNLDKIDFDTLIPDISVLKIFSQSNFTSLILHPLNSFKVDISEVIYTDYNNNFFIAGLNDNLKNINIYYYNINTDTDNYRKYATALSSINYEEFLNDLISVNDNHKLGHSSEIKQELLDHYDAEHYFDITKNNDYDDINSLAHAITKGYKSDYEKAEAICKYFQNNYSYDLSYNPPADKDTPSYFLFKSKKGCCYDFATAMTLMARKIGIPARYVEGYSPTEYYSDGVYNVTGKSSHAYVEVYINGLGWTVFEPTTSGNITAQENKIIDTINSKNTYSIFKISFIIGLIGIIIILLFKSICEFFFRLRLIITPKNENIIKLYKRLQSLADKKYSDNIYSMTTKNFYDYIKNKTGFEITTLITCVNEIAYNNNNCSQNEYKASLKEYKKASRLITKDKKKALH